MRRVWLPLALIVACLAVAFTRPVGADYGNLDCQLRVAYCDDAKPVLDALADGRLHALWDRQTLLGPASVLLRAPFVAAADAAGAGTRGEYRAGVLACLLALAAAGWLVARELQRRGRPEWLGWLVALGLVVNPLTFRAANFGHPEEALGAAASVAAGVVASGGRRGALAGLVVATKLWGLLALVPLVASLPRELWRRATVAAAGVVAVLYALPALGAPSRFFHAVSSANDLGTIPGTAQASNLWWFFMDKVPYDRAVAVADGQIVYAKQVGFILGAPLGDIAHPLVVALAVAAAVLWLRARGPAAEPADVLLLLAAIFLLRSVLDPNNFSYYHLPFLACLIAWEAITRGFPWLGIVSAGGLLAIISLSPHIHSDAGFVWLYLAWALPTLAGLALILCRRSRSTPPTPQLLTSPRHATVLPRG